jgi:hemolysin III
MPATAPYTRTEELAHSLTHALGIIACAAFIPVLVLASVPDPWRVVTGVIFGASALAMFVTSVVYHAASRPELKLALRKLDHSAIYLLIAGTYTPFALVGIQGAWGWSLFGIIWGLAAVGIIAKLWLGFRYPKLSVAMYLGMGWLAVIAIKPMIESLTAAQLVWILAGGLCYTAGVPFYVWKAKRYTHAVWHLFVLAGVACHCVAVFSVVSTPR